MQVITLMHEPPAGVATESEEAEADEWSLYDYPALYHRVFGYRDFSKEVRCFSHTGQAMTSRFALLTVGLRSVFVLTVKLH